MIKAKKSLGQNFLTDHIVINRILEAINPKLEERFFEIGSGRGELTKIFVPRVKTLESVEIDKYLMPELRKLELSSENLKIYEENVIKITLKNLSQDNFKYRVIGNLPYNLSSKIMLWSFQNSSHILDIHFMFQKEFGKRLISSPGKKSYGRLSVLSQYMFKNLYLFEISPESFKPKPSVKSVFIKFIPREKRDVNSSEALLLQDITKLMFSKRRKKISTSCKDILNHDDFIDLGINPDDRPESLSVEDFVKITNYLLINKNG